MDKRKKLRGLVEKRMISLNTAPPPDGEYIGILDTVIDGVEDEIRSMCAVDIIPDELLSAVADIAAADFAELLLVGKDAAGIVSSRTDGSLSIKYTDGMSGLERALAAARRMRDRGIESAKKYRRLRW